MTLVTTIQALVGAGAVLLFIEARASNAAGRSASSRARRETVEHLDHQHDHHHHFQPLLLIRWDDETADDRRRSLSAAADLR